MKKGCFAMLGFLSLPVVLLAVFQGEPIYRNLNGICGATGKRLNDKEFILKALDEVQSSRRSNLKKVKTSYNENGHLVRTTPDYYQEFINNNPNCCQVRRGYNEARLIAEGVFWEGALGEPSWDDRLIGSGYVRVQIDPRPLGVKEPFWSNKINFIDVYLDTCGGGGDEGAVRQRMGDG